MRVRANRMLRAVPRRSSPNDSGPCGPRRLVFPSTRSSVPARRAARPSPARRCIRFASRASLFRPKSSSLPRASGYRSGTTPARLPRPMSLGRFSQSGRLRTGSGWSAGSINCWTSSVEWLMQSLQSARRRIRSHRMPPALVFDLDGTLVDTVYVHVFAWQRAFAEAGMPIDGWRIHRRVGMSGGLFARAAGREVGRDLSAEEAEELQRRHGELFRELLPERRPLPGAVRLLRELRERGVIHGIATSGRRPEIDRSLDALAVPPETVVVERSEERRVGKECRSRWAAYE